MGLKSNSLSRAQISVEKLSQLDYLFMYVFLADSLFIIFISTIKVTSSETFDQEIKNKNHLNISTKMLICYLTIQIHARPNEYETN